MRRQMQRMVAVLLLFLLTTMVYGQQNLVQYDHDIYAEMKSYEGIEYPAKYFLKVGEKMVELDVEEFEDCYKMEVEDGHYYAIGKDRKRYVLNFKPQEVILFEKDEAYEAKCEEVAKDYKLHPENYEDVTVVRDDVVHSYTDKNGFEWLYETEGGGYHVLENEGVYMIFDEYKFIRKKEKAKTFETVEEMPEFPGGQEKLLAFLASHVKYPSKAMENGIQGRVIVGFVIAEDGSVVEPEVVKSIDPELDKEAIRVVKSMPKWKPGKKDGTPVRVSYKIPVTFRMS